MFRLPLLMLVATATTFAAATHRLAEIADSHFAADKFMGSVLVVQAGDVLLEKSYGFADLETKTPFTPATKFRIGSLTKQFTAAAILLLEQDGRLTLDDPVSQQVPDAPPAWEKVTLFHLLTHTSGIPSVTSLPGYATWKQSPSTPAQTLAHVRDLPLEFEPGEKFNYSNSGYILLGHILERLTGQSYPTFLRTRILEPLGLHDTGYDSPDAVVPDRATGYVAGPNGLIDAPVIHMDFPHAAGGLYSTPRNLLRWNEALFGGQLLSPASLEKMVTPFKDDYALGLIVKNGPGTKVIDHGGGIEGFNSHLAFYPESKLTVVVLANVNGPATPLAALLGAAARGERVTLPSERRAVDVPAEILKSYVGVYRLNPQITNTIRLTDGQLTTQLTGQPAFPLFPESETRFFLKVVDAQVEFSRDAQGQVTHLTQFQNGRSIRATRISDTVTERTAVDIPRSTKASYVGTYRLQPGFDLTITLEGDQLMSQATGQEKFPVFPESETKFFLKVVDAQIEFFKDPTGTITHLLLHQGGREMKAPRQ